MVTIELLNKDAMEMLKNMEEKNMISVKDDDWNPYIRKPEKTYPEGLAKRFYGSLKMSPERMNEILNDIQESRNEWERSIV